MHRGKSKCQVSLNHRKLISIIFFLFDVCQIQCTYVVGVYGYKNSSFTIMVTTSTASIVKLKPNIPQVIAMEKNQASYFSSLLASSAADTTVTLTALNSGSADLYIQIYNASTFTSGYCYCLRHLIYCFFQALLILICIQFWFAAGGGDQYVLPDPNDPSTYKYTTKVCELCRELYMF